MAGHPRTGLGELGLVCLLASCSGPPPGVHSDAGDPLVLPDGGTVVCARPTSGCPCDEDQPPIDCYLDPVRDEDGSIMCSRGTRYCRDGRWTSCESVQSYELRSGPGIGALVTGPTLCNACDPSCAISRDIPTDTDLPGRSQNVVYDGVLGGISLELAPRTVPLPDSDADGAPDVADECVGPGVLLAADGVTCFTGTYIYHTLPYQGPVETDAFSVTTIVRSADVYFLVDTTSSMGEEIANLQRDLTSGTFSACSGGIIGAVRCSVPDAYFGVGSFDDYPVTPYGSAAAGDQVYTHMQDITFDVTAAQAAVNALTVHYGLDVPESQSQALWAAATGGGLGPYLSPRTDCPAGTWGYPCFRDGVMPVVVLLTDAEFHNGPSSINDYAFGTPATSPPATNVTGNDTFAEAYDLGDAATSWQSFTGTTCDAVNDYTASCGATDSGDRTFTFTISTRTTITISTLGSTYDTLISLRNAGRVEVACDDDGGFSVTSELVVTLNPGIYFVVVAGYGTACGDFQLTVGNPSTNPAASGYPVTWAQTVDALSTAGIGVVTIQSGAGAGMGDADALADATGSYSSSGSRFVFPIAADGSGLSTAIIDAVLDATGNGAMDISAQAVGDTGGFVQSITATSVGAGSCATFSGSTFEDCAAGSTVQFTAAFQNDAVAPTNVPQIFDFTIDVLADGTTVLLSIPVRILVPPELVLYAPSGSYWRDYDSTLYCEDNERPDWADLSWEMADLPAGTSVRWELRTADTSGALDTAPAVSFTTPSTAPPVDVGVALVSGDRSNFLRHLRVTAVLLPTADLTLSPTLRSFELVYRCVPVE